MIVDRLISVAKGKLPADLILANAKVVNVFTGEVESGNVAICGDRIAGVGDYHQAKQVMDLTDRYIAPGLINGHTHLESSMLDVTQYARAVVPRGTLTVVTDLHEIANVCGLEGMRYMLDCVRRLPIELFLMAPSCVPATNLETSGAELSPEDIRQVLRWRGAIGLGEVMNFPGVLGSDPNVLRKISLVRGKRADGHAPGLKGKDLTAYIAAGIYSDHESVSLDEAREKLRQGMWVMIREGSSEKNLAALLPLVTDKTYRRCLFVVDDRSAVDLLRDGDIDAVVRKAIHLGLEPVRAIQLATINPAEYFRLDRLGAIAPGYMANLIVLNDLPDFQVDMVFYHGHLVAREGEPLFPVYHPRSRGALVNTINVKPFAIQALKLVASGETEPVIEVLPDQIVTRKRMEKVKTSDGVIMSDVSQDILKLVVVERHRATGNIGLGLVKGFGLKRGALASSIAHDAHNIIAVGADDESIFAAVKEIERLNGGLVVAVGDVLASLPLPIAGLLSEEPLEVVVERLGKLERLAKDLGTTLSSPFATLSFLALPVIPEIRLTDLGVIDVNASRVIK